MLVKIDSIKINERLRAVDESKVKEIAESIQKIGMLNPITLSNDNELIAGMHRLRACQLLGLIEVEARVVELDELERELAEIDENLIRYDLHYTDRGEHFRRRKEIYEKKYPETKQGGLPGKAGGGKVAKNEIISSFAEDTASTLNISERTVQQEIFIVENLAPEIRQIVKELGIPKTEALKLARLEPEKQKEALTKLKQVVWISIGELGVDVANVRGGEWDYNMEFVQDIKENGIINPLVVRPVNPVGGKKYAIVNGSRRYNAAIEAGIRKVPCFIVEMDDLTAIGRSIAENKHRSDIPAWRYVKKIREMALLLNDGEKGKEEIVRSIMDMTGLERTSVQNYLELGNLPDDVIELMKKAGERSEKVKELLKRMPVTGIDDALSFDKALKLAIEFRDIPKDSMFKVAAYAVGLEKEDAFRMIEDFVKAYSKESMGDAEDTIRELLKSIRWVLSLNLDKNLVDVIGDACVDMNMNRTELCEHYLKTGLENDGYLRR